MSSSYLSKKFKDESGQALMDYINKCRLNKSKELMKFTDKTLGVIAEEVGYSNIRTYNRLFKKYEGTAPSRYREEHLNRSGAEEPDSVKS